MKTLSSVLTLIALSLSASAVLGAPTAASFYSARPAERIADWQVRMAEIETELTTNPNLAATRLLFLGDSITHYWLQAKNPWIENQRGGRAIWDADFATPGSKDYALNMGITGDRTEHVLFRLLPKAAGGRGELDQAELNPDFFFIMIGINNTWSNEKPLAESVFAGIEAVISTVHKLRPSARIVVQTLLPTNDPERNHEVVEVVNSRLKKLVAADKTRLLAFLDLYPAYLDSTGTQRPELFCDGLHPNEAGYQIWGDRVLAFLAANRTAD
jgi:lysophospholipase L1-like esterase